MQASLELSSSSNSSGGGAPWIELALPYILELQEDAAFGGLAPHFTSAYLTCCTTEVEHSRCFTTFPGHLAPLAEWRALPEQDSWNESIQAMLFYHFDAIFLQVGLMITAWRCYELCNGRSRLCGCTVPPDHEGYTAGKKFAGNAWPAWECLVGEFTTALMLHQVFVPFRKFVLWEKENAAAATAGEAAPAEGAAATEAADKAAFVAAMGAAPAAMGAAPAELVGTSAGERDPGDVRFRGICSAGRGPAATEGLGLAGAAPPPPAAAGVEGEQEDSIAAARGGGGGAAAAEREAGRGRGGSTAAAATASEGGGGGPAALEGAGERGTGGSMAVGGGGGGAAAACVVAAGAGETATQAAEAGRDRTATAGGKAGTAAEVAQGEGGTAVAAEGAAAGAGVRGRCAYEAAQAKIQDPAASSTLDSSQQQALGEFQAGVLWLATVDYAEAWGETLTAYNAEKPRS